MTAHGKIRGVSTCPQRYHDLATTLGGTLRSNTSGCYCRLDTFADSFNQLGRFELGPLLATRSFPAAAFTLEEASGQISADNLLFVDTETTGLGGAGTVPFLIGCGQLKETGFEIRQYLLPDYSDETALLEDLLSEFSPDTVLVTYNGAAFDLPLLRDRFVINRVARQIPFAGHLDLLHSSRRLFKRRIKDCSLVNVEREVFGHIRREDIPGYLIPSVYFEWLNQQATGSLRLVLEHNRQDILTLAYLCHRISAAFESEGKSLDETDDLHSLSRIFGRRKQTSRAVSIFDRMAGEADRELSPDILLYQSFILKRSHDWPRACAIWQNLAERPGREGYWASVELAKYFEHREADIERARDFTRRALDLCPYGEEHLRRLDLRLKRLAAKPAR
ncbi:MAG: ribonuclease H-like domain-containing protein [candidate division Zixibacteria bacterium]|nr:ribonuclease H-like domain-containing protein [candidate division Zixibacteria bacterium]